MIKLPDPQQIARYQQWEQQSQSDLPGRYSMGFSGSPVFAIENEDKPLATDQVRIEENEKGIVVFCGEGGSALRVSCDGIAVEALRQCLKSLDGQTQFKEACCTGSSPDHTSEQLRRLCQLLLGRSVFLADVVDALEEKIQRVEIVRFPMQSPYMILRSYWSNCGDVRSSIPKVMPDPGNFVAFKSGLAALHVTTTMGCDLNTFYGGSGGVPTIPGGYRSHPMRTGLSDDKARFIDACMKDLGFAGLRRDDRLVYSESGTLLGAVADQGHTFRHPPPDQGGLDRILEEMCIVLAGVAAVPDGGRELKMPLLLSRFHKLFLHAHPFYNINNSVAMNIVNYSLKRAGFGVIPHLLLDFIALRTEFDEYATVFTDAVENYAFTSSAWHQEGEVLSRIAKYHAALQ